MVLGIRDGVYTRFIVRFDEQPANHYQIMALDNVSGADGDMLVLHGGVIVLKDGDGGIKLLSTSPKSTRIKALPPTEVGCFQLVHRGHGLGFVRGPETGTVRMK